MFTTTRPHVTCLIELIFFKSGTSKMAINNSKKKPQSVWDRPVFELEKSASSVTCFSRDFLSPSFKRSIGMLKIASSQWSLVFTLKWKLQYLTVTLYPYHNFQEQLVVRNESKVDVSNCHLLLDVVRYNITKLIGKQWLAHSLAWNCQKLCRSRTKLIQFFLDKACRFFVWCAQDLLPKGSGNEINQYITCIQRNAHVATKVAAFLETNLILKWTRLMITYVAKPSIIYSYSKATRSTRAQTWIFLGVCA